MVKFKFQKIKVLVVHLKKKNTLWNNLNDVLVGINGNRRSIDLQVLNKWIGFVGDKNENGRKVLHFCKVRGVCMLVTHFQSTRLSKSIG